MNKKTPLKHWSAITLILAMVLSTFTLPEPANASAGQATQFAVGNVVLKTKPARASLIEPFIDALFAYDDAVKANGGKPPKDAIERLKKIQSLSISAKSEIRALAQNLSANREIAAFNQFVAEKVKQSGSAAAVREFQAAGGNAHAILLGADSQIDQEISARAAAAKPVALLFLEDLFGVSIAEAGTGCSAFFFVISLGYATTANYKLCGLGYR
jgi:hypothetical protein